MIHKGIFIVLGGVALTYYLLREKIWEGGNSKKLKK